MDPESNVDDDGRELGITHWRVLARAEYDQDPLVRYVEVLLRAANLREAEELGREASDALFDAEGREPALAAFVEIDRIGPEAFASLLAEFGGSEAQVPPGAGVVASRWAG